MGSNARNEEKENLNKASSSRRPKFFNKFGIHEAERILKEILKTCFVAKKKHADGINQKILKRINRFLENPKEIF